MLNPLRGTSGIQIEKNIPDSLKRRAVVGHLHAVTVSYTMVIWHSELQGFPKCWEKNSEKLLSN